MRSLWQLIYRFHVLLVFIGLEVLAITLLIRNNNFHRAVFLDSSNELVGSLYARRTEISEYLKLQSINEKLARENALLKSEAPESFLKLTDRLAMVDDTLYLQRYAYMPARVINNSVNRVNNYITIDKGLQNGIDKEMGVASKGNVVGIVKDISDHFASVMPLINVNFSLGVKLSKSDAFGRVVWDGIDPTIAQVIEVPRYANPVRGDTVITSGYSSYFPEGLMVGTIMNYSIPEGENFYEMDIRLSTPFHELSYIDVIHHLLQEEQRVLQDASQPDTE